MNEKEIKESLLAANVSVEIAIENLQKVLGGENLYLGELVLQSITVLQEQERKLAMLRGFMEPEK